MLPYFLKRGKVLTDEHLGNASWSCGFVMTTDESHTLLLYSVKSVCILLEMWVPNDSAIFSNGSYQREISILSTACSSV